MRSAQAAVTRGLVFGAIFAGLTLAGCVMPPAPAAQAPATPPLAAPTATTEMAEARVAPTATTEMAIPTAAPEAMGTMVMLAEDPTLGSFLADDKGMTLYLFTKDEPNVSNCYDQCEANWPVLHTEGAPQAGEGVDASLLGTTTRTDGATQVTYNGWPLYYYIKDMQPGDVTGQDVGEVWYVISPAGEMITTMMAEPTAAAAETVKVSIVDFSFGDPLTVPVGTTVEWTNEDSAPHTVTADGGAFDSGNMNQQKGQNYDPTRGSFSGWLLSITRFAAIDRLRREGRRPVLDELPGRESRDGAALESLLPTDHAAWERGQHLRLLMGQLPADQQQVIELAYFGGLTHSELAEALGLPLGTVKGRLRLGLEKLRSSWLDDAGMK
jgi:RNA polymerase sigma factor (sigma-70 family)